MGAGKPAITVFGSLNMDLVIRTSHLPRTGETVLGGAFATFPGGKGGNQAVAAARLGAAVTMIGRVGADAFGRNLRDGLAAEGIDVSQVRVDQDAATGVALITVDRSGRNTIVVASGANMRVAVADMDAARALLTSSQVLLLQLEVPLEVVRHAVQVAHDAGCRVILDPAPAPPALLPEDMYRYLSVVNPNEVEAQALTGISISDESDARRAAERLLDYGCRAVVIKLGERGAYAATDGVRAAIPAIPVDVVDTTAAGDAFAAGMAVALAEGKALVDSARFANIVAAISVTRMGAQPSMPIRADVEEFGKANGLS